MKRVIIAATMLTALGLAAPVAAEDSGFYVSLSGFNTIYDDSQFSDQFQYHDLTAVMSIERGLGLLATVGYEVSSGMRAELEYGYRYADLDEMSGLAISGPFLNQSFDAAFPAKGSWTTHSLMANGRYSIETGGKVRPYLGVGVGLARHETALDDIDVPLQAVGNEDLFAGMFDDVVFALQFMAGIDWSVSEDTAIRFGYRRFTSANPDFDGTPATYGTHNVEVGILLRF